MRMSARSRAGARKRTRITGGELRGRALAVGPGVRPTEARLREALFSIWCELVPGARFLDLFAGSGAIGLEAASRGAEEVWLVEGSAEVARILESNVERVDDGVCRVIRAQLPAGLARVAELAREPSNASDQRFDLAFADPPYAFVGYDEVVTGVGGLMRPGGVLAVEHAKRRSLPPACGELELVDERNYGDKVLSFYRR